MIALDYSFLLQILLFLVVWLALAKFLFPPFLKLVEERERRTQGTKDKAAELASELARLKGQYEAILSRATAEGNAIKEGLREEADRERDRIIAAARAEAQERLEQAREEVRREWERAAAALEREAALLAGAIAERILGRELT